MHSNRFQSRAFALVELLAALTVVAVLIAIIIPAVAKIRKSARRAECISNLRQIVTAAQLFGTEHKGRLPVTRNASMGSFAANPATPHDGGLITALSPYISGSKKVFYCPEASPSSYTFEAQSAKTGSAGTSSGPYWTIGYYWLPSLEGVFPDKPTFPLLATGEIRRVLASCLYFGGNLPHDGQLNIVRADGSVSTATKTLDRLIAPKTLLEK